jgi:DNA-binding NarL/FixJ family response regulator
MIQTTGHGQHRTILLIDADARFRAAVGRELKKRDYRVLEASDPAHGLELYFTQRPDAVVLDLIMPEMPGVEVLERIMENDPDLPVVVVSASDDLEDALTALRLGACDYLDKATSPVDALEEILRRNIDEAEAVRRKNRRIDALRQEIEALNDTRRDFREKLLAQTREKQRLSAKLEENKNKVDDMTVTLRTVIQTVGEEKEELRHSIADDIRSNILPNLEKMAREESPEVRESFREVIEEQLLALVKGADTGIDDQVMLLTATELAVAQYIKAGRTTAQIADLMHSSLETIQTHRKNLRKKFDLVGKNIDLQVYLRTVKGL